MLIQVLVVLANGSATGCPGRALRRCHGPAACSRSAVILAFVLVQADVLSFPLAFVGGRGIR